MNKLNKLLNLEVKANNTPFGSYNVKGGMSFKTSVPSAYGQVDSISGPEQLYDSKGNCRIRHREYLKDILSTEMDYQEMFTLTANPTIEESFPWLSGMASNFQKFCFEKLCVRYVTQSPTTSPGSVMIIPIYDVDEDNPPNKAEALVFQDTTRSPAWQECCSLLPKNRLCTYKEYFTKIEPSNQKQSIPAKIVIATSGGSDSGPITGEIWVEYDIKLSCPQKEKGLFDSFVVDTGVRTSIFPPNFDPNPNPGIGQQVALGLIYTGNSIGNIAPGSYFLDWMAYNTIDAATGSINNPTAFGGLQILSNEISTGVKTTVFQRVAFTVPPGNPNASLMLSQTGIEDNFEMWFTVVKFG